MTIKRKGSVPSEKVPETTFAGNVTLESLNKPPEPARIQISHVTFDPGAHSAWHRHPLGQTLIVTSGRGWVQSEGGPKVEIHEGDVVWCPPNEKHWHGATPTTMMSHFAIQEALDGKMIEWLEKVTDEQYNK